LNSLNLFVKLLFKKPVKCTYLKKIAMVIVINSYKPGLFADKVKNIL